MFNSPLVHFFVDPLVIHPHSSTRPACRVQRPTFTGHFYHPLLQLMQTHAHTHTAAYNPIPISSPDHNGSKCVYKVSESAMTTTRQRCNHHKKCRRCDSYNDDGHDSDNHNNKSHETNSHNVSNKTTVTTTPPINTAAFDRPSYDVTTTTTQATTTTTMAATAPSRRQGGQW